MQFKYHCPHCNATLNPSQKIIFCIQKEETKCLILLSPDPGDYNYYIADEIKLQKGDIWDFLCPICHANLKAKTEDDNAMATILVISTDEKRRQLLFSRKVGVHATFILEDQEIKSFGSDSIDYESIITNKYWRL